MHASWRCSGALHVALPSTLRLHGSCSACHVPLSSCCAALLSICCAISLAIVCDHCLPAKPGLEAVTNMTAEQSSLYDQEQFSNRVHRSRRRRPPPLAVACSCALSMADAFDGQCAILQSSACLLRLVTPPGAAARRGTLIVAALTPVLLSSRSLILFQLASSLTASSSVSAKR
jgi:hypothetical protein